MMKLTYKQMVKAMLTDDSRFDGRFYVCVKTTGIYCLPSCPAKQPNLGNVVFYETREEAIAAGFRGCKRCRAEFFLDSSPSWLDDAIKSMRNGLSRRIHERDLAAHAGVNISTVRRYFKSHLHTTPMAFHRKMRLAHAKSLIESGTNYLTAAFESGFESSSGFRDAFVRHYGYPPGRTNGTR
jgi:AraC family transcriptional regulator of adaptative response/methylated-DNA-[protein]-cysteine methyltransferase